MYNSLVKNNLRNYGILTYYRYWKKRKRKILVLLTWYIEINKKNVTFSETYFIHFTNII